MVRLPNFSLLLFDIWNRVLDILSCLPAEKKIQITWFSPSIMDGPCTNAHFGQFL